MADYTDSEFSNLLDQLAQLPVEDRASDLLKLLKTLLTKNVTVQDWNTLIRDIAPLYATMLGLNDCMVNLINKVQRELGIVTGSSDSALHRIIALEDGTRSLANDKFDKTGGTITGPVTVTDKLDVQSLTVHGTTTTTDTTHLSVKDAIIETNVDAETAESIPLLSGYVIHIGDGKAYGIVYDKIAKSVKLGLVEKTTDGTYRFQNGEGQPVATRADSAELAEHGIALWDAANHRFIAKDMTDLDLNYGNTTVTYDTIAGLAFNGQSRFTYDGGTTKDVTTIVRLPVYDGEGITIDKVNGQDKVEVKLDTAFTDRKYVKSVAGTANGSAVYLRNEKGVDATAPLIHHYPQPWSVVQRGAGGVVKVGTAVSGSDAMPKKQVEDGFVAKVTTSASNPRLYGITYKGKPIIVPYSQGTNAQTVAMRGEGGVLKVGNPAAPKDAVNLEYLTAQLGAVTGASPYFMHNICITQTVDNVVNTVRVSLVCTQVTKITSVAALHALIVQLSNNAAVGERSMPTWHGVCKMLPLTMAEGIPSTLTVYSGDITAGEGTQIIVWGDSPYPNAGYRIEPNDTDWTISDSVLNAVVGGTTT